MRDQKLFDLNDSYDLAYDSHQWIIRRKKGRRSSGHGAGEDQFSAIKFIGSTKKALLRCMVEANITPTSKAFGRISELEDTFFAFLDRVQGNGFSELA